MEFLASTAVALVLASGTPIDDPLIEAALAESRALCAENEGTELVYDGDFVTEVDLTGDGRPDRIVTEAGALCLPGGGYLYTGTAGAPVHAIVGDHVQALGYGSWGVADVELHVEGEVLPPRRVLLMGVHGSNCGGAGAMPCMIAHVWDGTRMVSLLDGLDDLLAP